MSPSRPAALLIAAATLVSAPARATSADLPMLDIPHLSGVVIDGGAEDWGDGGLRLDILTPNRPRRAALDDFDGQVRLAWDERGVLVLAEVADDFIKEAQSIGALWAGDGVELFMAVSRGAGDLLQYAVAPGVSEGYAEARWFLHDFRQDAAMKELGGEPEFAGRRTVEGYSLEGFVPWQPLGIEPQPGRVVAFQFYINDYDEGGFERLLFYPAEQSHESSLTFRELRLAQDPGPPVRSVERVSLPAREGDPVGLTVDLRHDGKADEFELLHGTSVLQSAAPDTTGPIVRLHFQIPGDRVEQVADRLSLRADGEIVAALRIPPAYLASRKLLARGREVAEGVASGHLAPDRTRAAALVLAWTDLLEQTAIDQGERDVREVVKRARNVQVCAQRLEQALEDYETPGDAFADRRGGFLSGYISSADRSGQIYSLYVPPHYDPARAWPLHVHMHGYGGTYGGGRNPDPALDYLMAFVDGRGQTGYMGLGERDVLEVIADVREYYHIDENRIYARGGGMGGRGTWSVTTRTPDLFAAALPDYGWADGLFIENLGNTPVWNFHDDTDWSVAVDHSRAAVDQLREWGYPVIHTEATGGGHSMASFALQDQREAWLASQVRDPYPRRVRHAARTPYRGKAYWVEILEFADPNLPAYVDVRARDGNELYLTAKNVRLLGVELADELFDRNAALTVLATGDPRMVEGPLPERIYVALDDTGGVEVSPGDPRPVRPYRPYIAGGLNYIWSSGEPFVIVRPTQGNDERLLAQRDEVSEFLSRETGSWYREQMPIGRIPVVDDVQVTDRMMEQNNLVLVGPASANAVLQRLMRDLPVRERGDELVFREERLPFAGRMYNLFYYNPEAPERYIAVISTAEVDSLQPRMTTDFVNHEAAYGFHLREIAPLPRELKRVRWDHQWRPQLEPGDDESLPARLGWATGWAEAFGQAACAATGSEYFMSYLPEDPAAYAWDPAMTTWGDLRADLGRPMDFYRATLTGGELLEMAEAVLDSLDGAGFVPALEEAGIRVGSAYRVCMASWMPWDLAGKLHYNLPQVGWARTDEMWLHFERLHRAK